MKWIIVLSLLCSMFTGITVPGDMPIVTPFLRTLMRMVIPPNTAVGVHSQVVPITVTRDDGTKMTYFVRRTNDTYTMRGSRIPEHPIYPRPPRGFSF